MTFTLAADVPDSYRYYRSAQPYDMTNGQFAVELVEAPTAPADAFLIADAGADELILRLRDDELQVVYIADGSTTEVASVPFEADEMRWWRLLEDNGATFWQTSADGKAWTDRGVVSPTPVDVTHVDVRFGAGTPLANPTPGRAVFDNFNRLPE